MQLTAFETDSQSIHAGYACPCGCTPSVSYQRGAVPSRAAAVVATISRSGPGPSVHADTAVDSVCGMRVEREAAVAKRLHRQHEGNGSYFYAKGCYLDLGDDPGRYLDPAHVPSM